MRQKAIGLGAIGVLVALSLLGIKYGPDILNCFLEKIGLRKGSTPVAVYRNMTLFGKERMFILQTGEDVRWVPEGSIADLFVRIDGGLPIVLKDVTEEMAGEHLDKKYEFENSSSRTLVCYTDGYTYLIYWRTQLVAAELHEATGISIASAEAGPYHRLPIDRKTMLQLFGRPIRYERFRTSGP